MFVCAWMFMAAGRYVVVRHVPVVCEQLRQAQRGALRPIARAGYHRYEGTCMYVYVVYIYVCANNPDDPYVWV